MRVHMYVGWVFFKMVPTKETVVVHLPISCESVMETMKYASKTIVLPDICYYCGGRSVSLLCNNAKIKQLKKEYTKVQPICTSCVTDGKEPVTWGACSNLVKKKK